MNDDLPEIFDQLQPPPAPSHLRSRVLTTVNGELAKPRKPRWERVLELSVAASFVLGVGLNVWQFRGIEDKRPPSGVSRTARNLDLGGPALDELMNKRMAIVRGQPDRPKSWQADYEKLIAELSRQPAG